MKKHIFVNGKEFEIEIKNEGNKNVFINKNKKIEAQLIDKKIEGKLFAIINNECVEFLFLRKGRNKSLIIFDGKEYEIEIGEKKHIEEKVKDNFIYAPMPGIVTEIKVKIGERVNKGTPLLIMESMKMQIEISAPFDGEVEEIYIKENSPIKKEDKLLKMKK
ncbi:MAG: biotin/lipoyl-containing protein [candidate division WOR-3 bacterium]